MDTSTDCNPIDATPGNRRHAGRQKLWQLDNAYHGSLIGTCLSQQELEELCRKLRITVVSPAAHELRRALVGVAGEPSPLARRLHKFLDRKYWATILHFTTAHSTAALETLWREAVAAGELAGAYWALATHSHASSGLLERVHGEVHRRSHPGVDARRLDEQEVKRMQRLIETLTKQFVEAEMKATERIAERDVTINRLQGRLARAEAVAEELDRARERLAALESEPLALRLRKQVEQYAAKLAGERLRAERAEASAGEWRRLAMSTGDRHQRLAG